MSFDKMSVLEEVANKLKAKIDSSYSIATDEIDNNYRFILEKGDSARTYWSVETPKDADHVLALYFNRVDGNKVEDDSPLEVLTDINSGYLDAFISECAKVINKYDSTPEVSNPRLSELSIELNKVGVVEFEEKNSNLLEAIISGKSIDICNSEDDDDFIVINNITGASFSMSETCGSDIPLFAEFIRDYIKAEVKFEPVSIEDKYKNLYRVWRVAKEIASKALVEYTVHIDVNFDIYPCAFIDCTKKGFTLGRGVAIWGTLFDDTDEVHLSITDMNDENLNILFGIHDVGDTEEDFIKHAIGEVREILNTQTSLKNNPEVNKDLLDDSLFDGFVSAVVNTLRNDGYVVKSLTSVDNGSTKTAKVVVNGIEFGFKYVKGNSSSLLVSLSDGDFVYNVKNINSISDEDRMKCCTSIVRKIVSRREIIGNMSDEERRVILKDYFDKLVRKYIGRGTETKIQESALGGDWMLSSNLSLKPIKGKLNGFSLHIDIDGCSARVGKTNWGENGQWSSTFVDTLGFYPETDIEMFFGRIEEIIKDIIKSDGISEGSGGELFKNFDESVAKVFNNRLEDIKESPKRRSSANIGEVAWRLVALKYDGDIVGYRFKRGDEGFDISIEKAKQLGVSSFKVAKAITLEDCNGLLMSKSEIKSGKCCEDISENTELVANLFNQVVSTKREGLPSDVLK